MLFRLVRRALDTHPDHQVIAKGMAWVVLFLLLGSMARVAKEISIAYRYGISSEVDSYIFLVNLIGWPVAIWASVLTVVLVPLASKIRSSKTDELAQFRSELLGLSILLAGVLWVVCAALIPVFINTRMVGLPDSITAPAASILPVLITLAPLGIITSLFSVWVLSSGKHTNSLLEGIPPLVIASVLVVWIPQNVAPLVWSTLAGTAFQLVVLWLLLTRSRAIERPRFSFKSKGWGSFWDGFGIMLTGQILMSITGVVDQFFAAHEGSGTVATLSYANKLLTFILSIGAVAISRATLPVFSNAQASNHSDVRRIVTQWAVVLFVSGCFIGAAVWWLAPVLVKLLFERGAFTSFDTFSVAEVFRFGLLQIPFYFSGLIIVSYLSSKSLYKWLLVSGALGLVVKLICNFLLVQIYGVSGIVMATGIMYAANFLFLCLVFRALGLAPSTVSK